MPKNEAELESLVAQTLRNIFPTFKEVRLEHQKSFSIKLGHHMVTVDLKDPKKYPSRAIFDILLTIDGKPTILLELKREGLPLTDEDLNQGLSYARLIDPMPPLTIISNGHDNLLHNTYTKGKIQADTVDFKDLQTLIDHSFKIAMNDFKEAVQTLLNKDYTFFSNVINSSSKAKFNLKTGGITQFDKVICEDLLITREIQKNIEEILATQNRHVGIVGPAFSGKTNLLYNIFKSVDASKEFAFYIDCNDYSISILQQLAADMSTSSKIYINKDRIREFFSNSLSEQVNFYLLIDNFNNGIPSAIMEEILELKQLFKAANHKVVFTVDEFNLQKLVSVKNRTYRTSIGEFSKILKLQELSLSEYHQVHNLMLENYRIGIAHGGEKAAEYRQPRILRHLVATYQHVQNDKYYQSFAAVPNQDILKLICENPAYPRELHSFYKNISLCFLKEHYLRRKNPELGTMAFLSGAVTSNSYETMFKKDLKRILRSGFIVQRYLSDGTAVIYPKIPELVAFYAVDPLLGKLLKMQNNDKSIKDTVLKFIDLIEAFPCADIIGAYVLEKLIEFGEINLFLGIVKEFLEMPPKIEPVQGEMKALTYFEDFGHVNINITDGTQETVADVQDNSTVEFQSDQYGAGSYISNYLPYPILSQLASRVFVIGDDPINEGSLAPHRFLISKVGSHPHFIMRTEVRPVQNMQHIETYCIDAGEVVSHREGIVEAIAQSIQTCYIIHPAHVDRIVGDALKNNDTFLLWRIFQALEPLVSSVNTVISTGAAIIIADILKYREDIPIC